jgi:hypothetical protein
VLPRSATLQISKSGDGQSPSDAADRPGRASRTIQHPNSLWIPGGLIHDGGLLEVSISTGVGGGLALHGRTREAHLFSDPRGGVVHVRLSSTWLIRAARVRSLTKL